MTTVSVFFDGGVFADGVRGSGMSMDMNLKDFASGLIGDGTLGEVYYIAPVIPATPYPNKHANQKALFDKIAQDGVKIETIAPKVIGSIFVDAGVETLLTTRMLTDAMNGKFDKAVVVSNRAALSPALQALRDMGKSVEVAFFDYTVMPGNALAPEGFKTIAPASVIALTRSGPRPPEWT